MRSATMAVCAAFVWLTVPIYIVGQYARTSRCSGPQHGVADHIIV